MREDVSPTDPLSATESPADHERVDGTVDPAHAERRLTAIALAALPIYHPDPLSLPEWRPGATYRRSFWVIALLGLVLYIPNAGSFGLWDPWETHYGEVTRNMVESHDFVSPWWGFKEKIGTEGVQGKPFFSKPVYLFWIEAIFVKLIGFGEWAIRLPVAIIGWLAALSVFMAIARLSRRDWAGLLAGIVVATSPQFFFLARQAQTDMPFAGTLTIALCFFAMAMFGPREQHSDDERVATRAVVRRIGAVLALILLSAIPQYGIIATDLFPDNPGALDLGERLWKTGTTHAAVYAILLSVWSIWQALAFWRDYRAAGGTFDAALRDRWLRRSYLWVFYVLCAHSTLAKGLLGFMLPGAVVFVFVLVTATWRSLGRMQIPSGILLFITVGFPWYVAMFARHGMAYYNRFFIHDHFNRLGAGVHQIDSGTFEHFLKWLGYGMFPWVAVVPFAAAAFLRIRRRDLDTLAAGRLFVFVWFLVAFTLFTVSSTKFHHYIFPALPAMAMLVGWELAELGERSAVYRRAMALIAVVLVAAVGWNIRGDVQSLRNLFTYKYDRPLPADLPTDVDARIAADSDITWGESIFWDDSNPLVLNLLNSEWTDYKTVIVVVVFISLIGFGLLYFRRTARWSALVVGGAGGLLALYSLNVYMPMLSPHWSQKYLFDKYYDDCTLLDMGSDLEESYTPLVARIGWTGLADYLRAENKRVCREDIISWLITWRGETYYSNNEIRPISKEAAQFEAYLTDFNRGKPFYVLMERGKERSWGRSLETKYLKKALKDNKYFEGIVGYDVEKIFNENRYFILVKVIPKYAEGHSEG